MEYMTAEEYARKLRVSTRTITRLCNQGRIPGAEKVGAQWRIKANGKENVWQLGKR